jgi:hypothetical protein
MKTSTYLLALASAAMFGIISALSIHISMENAASPAKAPRSSTHAYL